MNIKGKTQKEIEKINFQNLERALDEQQVCHYDPYDCELMMELAVSVTNFQCSHAASQLLNYLTKCVSPQLLKKLAQGME